MKRCLSVIATAVCCFAVGGAAAALAANSTTQPAPSSQRQVAEQWVGRVAKMEQRGACELQTKKEALGQPCGNLPGVIHPKCPKAPIGSKPPYRKSELRAPNEQVGKYTEESASRGFVVIKSQLKASKQTGVLGLEQGGGGWEVTYLRYGSEIIVPAGNVFLAEALHKLWVTNKCPVAHPHWEKKK